MRDGPVNQVFYELYVAQSSSSSSMTILSSPSMPLMQRRPSSRRATTHTHQTRPRAISRSSRQQGTRSALSSFRQMHEPLRLSAQELRERERVGRLLSAGVQKFYLPPSSQERTLDAAYANTACCRAFRARYGLLWRERACDFPVAVCEPRPFWPWRILWACDRHLFRCMLWRHPECPLWCWP